MDEKWNKVKSHNISPADVEILINREYGHKVNPVKPGALAKKYRSDAIRRAAVKPPHPCAATDRWRPDNITWEVLR